MDSKKLALRCRELAENRKAEDVLVLEVQQLSSVTDYFVLATATSEPHLRAIMEEITETLRTENGLRQRATDGSPHQAWIVLDYFDVIVHLMRADIRKHYNLEGLWGDAPRLKPARRKRASPLSKLTSKTPRPGSDNPESTPSH